MLAISVFLLFSITLLSSFVSYFLCFFVIKLLFTYCWSWTHLSWVHLVVSAILLSFVDISVLAGVTCVFGVSA